MKDEQIMTRQFTTKKIKWTTELWKHAQLWKLVETNITSNKEMKIQMQHLIKDEMYCVFTH